MHIPDAYLSPLTQLATFTVASPFVVVAARKTQATLTSRQVPLLSIGAAFCFAIQMFNIPAIGGTTAHALGTILLAILLGPWTALITMALNLSVQALFFGDGGVLSIGANVIDMGIIPAFVGSFLYQRLSSYGQAKDGRRLIAAAFAAYCGTSVASLSAGFILGLQPLVAHDSVGHALYFPFGWNISIPAMVSTHLLVAAPAEAIITAASLAYLWRNFPELSVQARTAKTGSALRLSRAVGIALLLTPLGLIAAGDAWGEWDPEELKKLIGYVPTGAGHAHEIIKPVLPDYGLPHSQGVLLSVIGYLISAFVGGGLVALVIRVLCRKAKVAPALVEQRQGPQATLPQFLTSSNTTPPHFQKTKNDWLQALVLRMRARVEETVVAEKNARRPGFLQALPSAPKMVLGFGLLLAVAITHDFRLLTGTAVALSLVAYLSRIPLGPFVGRVLGSTLFFGAILAIPVSLASVTPGHPVFGQSWFAVSDAGLRLGSVILLRLFCGIGLCSLVTSSTRWNDIVSGLSRSGLPPMLCTSLSLAYRYIFVTLDILTEMATARRSRQVGRLNKEMARTYAGAGTAILFGKSFALAEEVHMAMRSRCFGQKSAIEACKKNLAVRGEEELYEWRRI